VQVADVRTADVREVMMLDLKKLEAEVQYVMNQDGEKTAVIVPFGEFQDSLEEIEDLAAVAERRDEPTISHDELLARLKTGKV
jgi:hypothetical protein